MNQNTTPDGSTDNPWSHSPTLQLPDTSMLQDTVVAPPAAAGGLLKGAVQGAHATIDRLADGAAPAVKQLGESVSAAEVALKAKGDQLRVSRDEWAQVVRTKVRGNPLAALAAALTLGAVIARLTR